MCPCGSETELSKCCLPFIEGKVEPDTAEQLLRSRYTAFTRGDVEYILASHHPRTRQDVKREEIENWSKNSEWLGMKVLQKEAGGPSDTQGKVAFHVQYNAAGKLNDHYEQGLFEREPETKDGKWRFVDAQGLKPGPMVRGTPKVGRNEPCPCGSGKKHKKCCG